jgi:hypothetical protein
MDKGSPAYASHWKPSTLQQNYIGRISGLMSPPLDLDIRNNYSLLGSIFLLKDFTCISFVLKGTKKNVFPL